MSLKLKVMKNKPKCAKVFFPYLCCEYTENQRFPMRWSFAMAINTGMIIILLSILLDHITENNQS